MNEQSKNPASGGYSKQGSLKGKKDNTTINSVYQNEQNVNPYYYTEKYKLCSMLYRGWKCKPEYFHIKEHQLLARYILWFREHSRYVYNPVNLFISCLHEQALINNCGGLDYVKSILGGVE